MSTNSAGFSCFKPKTISRSIDDYADILNTKRPMTTATPMNISDRAAQFAPFAAPTGHKELIGTAETAQTTDNSLLLHDED